MRSTVMILGLALGLSLNLSLAGCSGRNEDTLANESSAEAVAANAPAEAPANAAAAESPGAGAAAAAEVVRAYALLAEKHDMMGAAQYWTDASDAAQFAADLEEYPKVAMKVGKPSNPEGAAGSSFVSVPIDLTLTLRSGALYDMTCKASLRRVNDVPGATARQLRWNIEKIDC